MDASVNFTGELNQQPTDIVNDQGPSTEVDKGLGNKKTKMLTAIECNIEPDRRGGEHEMIYGASLAGNLAQ